MYAVSTPNGFARLEDVEAVASAVRVTRDEYPATEGDQILVRRGVRVVLWLRFDGRRWRRLDQPPKRRS